MVKYIDSSRKNSKKKLAAFLGMALVSTVMGISGASAKVSSKNIYGTSKYFKKDYFALALGKAASDSGLTHDLRFMLVGKPGVNKDGSRRYVGDASSSSLGQLLIDLLPSPGGNISPTADIKENFGKPATVETFASILKFVNDIRKSKEEFEDNKLQPLPKGPEHTNAERNARMDDIRRSETSYKKSADALKKAVSKEILHQNRHMNKRALNNILSKVIGSIDEEYLPHSFYPKHITEQVLMSFFCERFENDDVWKLVNILDDDIVDHPLDEQGQRILLQGPPLDKEQLNEIAHKDIEEPYDMDDVFALENAPIFFALTPYKAGTAPVDNAPGIKAYNQQTGQFEDAKFSDCEETMLRHFLNLIFYNPDTKTFDLSILDTQNLSIAANLKAFYEAQTPDKANEGGKLRDLWNTVVGDLNNLPTTFQSPKIEYAQKVESSEAEFELKPNIINSIHVLQKLFEVDLAVMPTDGLENKQQWIKDSFQSIFKKLNDKRDYEINISNLTPAEKDEEMFTGPVSIKVFEDEKPLFSFEFMSTYYQHSYMKEVEDVQKDVDLSIYETAAKQHHHTFMDQDTEQSLWSIGGEAFADHITHPLYQLFHQKLSDNNARIDFLKLVNEQFDNLKTRFLSSNVNMGHFNTILKNVLEGVSWEDDAVLKEASDIIFVLSQHSDLQEILYKNVKGFEVNDPSTFEEFKLHFNNIEKLIFKNAPLDKIDVGDFKKLKELDLSGSNIEEIIGLHTLNKLQLLNIEETKVKKISLNGLENLEFLYAMFSAIEEIEGLHTLSKLQALNLSGIKDFQKLSVEGLKNLKLLSLDASDIETIEGLSTLNNLEWLYLNTTEKLKTISVSGLEKLKALNLNNSTVEIIEGLSTLKSLEKLNLNGAAELKAISMKGLENLLLLDIDNSSIEKIEEIDAINKLEFLSLNYVPNFKEIFVKNLESLTDLVFCLSNAENLIGLEDLDLGNFKNLYHVTFLGDFSLLNTLSLANLAQLRGIDGLNNAPNLKILNLEGTDHLSKYDPEGLRNELKIKDYEMIGVDLSQLLLPEEQALGPQELLNQGYARQVVLAADYYVDELVNAGFHLWEIFSLSNTHTQEEILEAYSTVNFSTVSHDDLIDLTLMAFGDFTEEKVLQLRDEEMRTFLTEKFEIPGLRQILSQNTGTNMYLNERLFNDDDIRKLAEENKVVLPHSSQIAADVPQEATEEMTLVAPLSQTYTEEITEFPVEQKLTGVHNTKSEGSSEVEKTTASAVPISEDVEVPSKTKRKLPMQKETEENGE